MNLGIILRVDIFISYATTTAARFARLVRGLVSHYQTILHRCAPHILSIWRVENSKPLSIYSKTFLGHISSTMLE